MVPNKLYIKSEASYIVLNDALSSSRNQGKTCPTAAAANSLTNITLNRLTVMCRAGRVAVVLISFKLLIGSHEWEGP
jgi:hypothetical protein